MSSTAEKISTPPKKCHLFPKSCQPLQKISNLPQKILPPCNFSTTPLPHHRKFLNPPPPPKKEFLNPTPKFSQPTPQKKIFNHPPENFLTPPPPPKISQPPTPPENFSNSPENISTFKKYVNR